MHTCIGSQKCSNEIMPMGANTLLTQWEEKAIVSPSCRTRLHVYGQELFAI